MSDPLYPRHASSNVLRAAGEMLMDRNDCERASLENRVRELETERQRTRETVKRFLEDLERKGIDLQRVPTFEFMQGLIDKDKRKADLGIDIDVFTSVDDELLIQLRDLVRRP